MSNINRRNFLGAGLLLGASTLLGKETPKKIITNSSEYAPPMVAFPQKKPMKTISDRPPLLESPRDIFTNPITPNDQFFVRFLAGSFIFGIDLMPESLLSGIERD